jgi:uncharacterized membrane protein YphA (DoxX/SURF4 family)
VTGCYESEHTAAHFCSPNIIVSFTLSIARYLLVRDAGLQVGGGALLLVNRSSRPRSVGLMMKFILAGYLIHNSLITLNGRSGALYCHPFIISREYCRLPPTI